MRYVDPALDEAKQRITIASAWRKLGLPKPSQRETGNFHSPLREDKKASFSIFNEGHSFHDKAEDVGGDVIKFIQLSKGCDFKEAKAILLGWAGLTLTTATPRQAPHTKLIRKANRSRITHIPTPDGISDADLFTFHEGIEYLLNRPELQAQIDRWRKWPASTTLALAEDDLISCIKSRGQRALAFPAQVPFTDSLGLLSTFNAGYHLRPKPAQGERVLWFFQPKGIGSWPFLMGGGHVPSATHVHLCEGQWDAVSLAAHSGWLNSDTSWADGHVIFATRGATALAHLCEVWLPKLSFNPETTLYPDNDPAGRKWTEDLLTNLRGAGLTRTNVFDGIEEGQDLSDYFGKLHP